MPAASVGGETARVNEYSDHSVLLKSASARASAFSNIPMVGRRATKRGYASPRSTGWPGSELHSDHDPGYNAASRPVAASAAMVTAAVTPDPQ